MKKAELEHHDNAYQALMYKANAALRSNLYGEATDFAVAAWDHIDGMIQFQRKFADNEVSSVQAIDIVLHYAPLLMDFETLDRLEGLLHSQRRITKSTDIDWETRLRAARVAMWECHQFWTYFEEHGSVDEAVPDFGKDDRKHWPRIAEDWIAMGLVSRDRTVNASLLSLVTDYSDVVLAKCPSCGSLVKGRKSGCLEEHHCPKCHKRHVFVMLAKSPTNPA